MSPRGSFIVRPVPPFRLDLTVWVLRRRPDNQIDRWDGAAYRRVLTAGGAIYELSITQHGSQDEPYLEVVVTAETVSSEIIDHAAGAVSKLLGTGVDLGAFYDLSSRDDDLLTLAKRFRGVKPPRFPSGFEALVNAIVCQQLTLTVGIQLLNKLAVACGPRFETSAGVTHAFPRPQDLAVMDHDRLRGMGFSYQKARYLTNLAQLVRDKEFDPESLADLSDAAAIDRLCALTGVGRWSAEYFLLRGLGRTNTFPGDDVGARNHLQRWQGLPGKLGYDDVRQITERWNGYAGLVYFHLLVKSLAEKGWLSQDLEKENNYVEN